jgi:hypothetical protein
MATYVPETIDTSQVEMEPELERLVEQLARNNHDHWAQSRINEGWRYGSKRDDHAKEHPDLVPYHDLPESEKEYDRKTVVEALKAIVALGYEIKPRQSR